MKPDIGNMGNFFDIPGLATSLFEIVCNNSQEVDPQLKEKIMGVLQRKIDQRLVPKNWSEYDSRKRRNKWLQAIRQTELESNFWRGIVKQLVPDITEFYTRLDAVLIEKGLKKPQYKGPITCYYCERNIDAARFGSSTGVYSTKDHVIPKSKFGPTNHTNLVIACNDCNFLKADLSLQGFIEKVAGLINLDKPFRTLSVDRYPIIIKKTNELLIKQTA
jgi:hypothetical protein